MKHFLMCLLYIAALGVLSFVVGRLIPKHWFHADRFPWVCHPAEQKLWKRLHVRKWQCALPGFVDSKNEEKTERNAGYLVVSHSGGGMLRQGTRKGIRRTPANRGMRAHWVVKGLDISEDVCHGMCP